MKRPKGWLIVIACHAFFVSCVSLAGASRTAIVIMNTTGVDQRLTILVDDELIYRGWVSRQAGEPNIAATLNLRMTTGSHIVRVERSDIRSSETVKFDAHRQTTIEVIIGSSTTELRVKEGARIYM